MKLRSGPRTRPGKAKLVGEFQTRLTLGWAGGWPTLSWTRMKYMGGACILFIDSLLKSPGTILSIQMSFEYFFLWVTHLFQKLTNLHILQFNLKQFEALGNKPPYREFISGDLTSNNNDNNNNHNYNKIVKSDWLSTTLISALIRQFNRTVRVMPK